MQQLKIKFDNLKMKARKYAADMKFYCRGTGGGPLETKDIDPVIDVILRIISKITVVGHNNQFDCDAELNEESVFVNVNIKY